MADMNRLYRELDKHSPRYLFLFPLVAGLAWFFTLSVMLTYWLVIGQPTYPGQSNPYIAFISDIAAFHLKIFFVIACTITSITYVGTVFSVHYARHSTRYLGLPGGQSTGRTIVSTITLVSGAVSGVSLFLLALYDTVHEHERHRTLLLCTFGGLIVTTLGMGSILGDAWIGVQSSKRRERVGGMKGTERVRKWCAINFGLMLVIAVLGALFVISLYMRWMRPAGVIEWVVAYAGSLWLLSFVGFLRGINVDQAHADHIDDESEHDDGSVRSFATETDPLLGNESDRS